MFSLLKNCYTNRQFRCLLKQANLDNANIQILPRRFCAALASSRNNDLSIEEIDSRHFSELISESESSEKFSCIVSEIRTAIARKHYVPQFLNSDEIVQLCSLDTRTQRKGYLAFLCKKEKLRKSDAEKKEKRRRERESTVRESNNSEHITYGLGRNSLMLSLRSHSMNKFYDKRLANAALFGENIVLDLSYDDFMTDKEKQLTATQLKLVYSANRKNYNPYDVYFCNVREASKSVKYFKKGFHSFENSLLTVTDSNYLDFFSQEKLVYLSPHAEETLQEYDHSAIYIIGAFVDTVKKTKVSSNKAQMEGIKSFSLPLDEYIMWGAGSKSLTINQVFDIMLVMKNTGDWKMAFQVIPHRKIRKIDSEQIENHGLSNKIFLMDTSKNKGI